MSAIKNGREEIHHASRSAANIMETDERHKVKVKSVLERTRSISPTAIITTEVSASRTSVYLIFNKSLAKGNVSAR
jgi:hypothetical protein